MRKDSPQVDHSVAHKPAEPSEGPPLTNFSFLAFLSRGYAALQSRTLLTQPTLSHIKWAVSH